MCTMLSVAVQTIVVDNIVNTCTIQIAAANENKNNKITQKSIVLCGMCLSWIYYILYIAIRQIQPTAEKKKSIPPNGI